MGYAIHIVRQSDTGAEIEITLEEWNTYLQSDSELKRPAAESLNYKENLVFLASEPEDSENVSWLAWTSGSLHSEYPQKAMLKKIGQIARHFNAIVTSDDGDIWTIDDHGQVSMEGY